MTQRATWINFCYEIWIGNYEECYDVQKAIRGEKSFVLAQEKDGTYLVNGKIHIDLPCEEAICLEY